MRVFIIVACVIGGILLFFQVLWLIAGLMEGNNGSSYDMSKLTAQFSLVGLLAAFFMWIATKYGGGKKAKKK